MIWIASQGYLADYLSHDEAVAYCVKAGKKLQSLFNSWDEMFHHYMQGYIYWSKDDPDDGERRVPGYQAPPRRAGRAILPL
jgi:hypothetical protein